MRKFGLIAAFALMLGGCGGETYPLAASDAYASLTSIGVPAGAEPLSVMHEVSVDFEALPDDNSVRWTFSHEGDNLGAIVAHVDPSGDKASTITTDYVEGSSPDDKWRNGKMRGLIQGGSRQLIEEAIRSHFENRPFDHELRRSIDVAALQANLGTEFSDISKSMDKAAANFEEADREDEARRATNPNNATKPSIDLEHKEDR